MSYGKYILKGKKPVLEPNLLRWGKWFETGNRNVGKDNINDIKVSTVFLGLDHSFGHGKPLLFETMIFGGKHDEYQERYESWEEAEEGHKKAVKMVEENND